MNTILKRVISMVLCFVLVAGYLPVGTFATETVETVPAETTAVTEETIQVLSEDAEEPSESTETTEDESEITEPSTEATVPENTEETVPETTEETVPETTEETVPETTEETVPETTEETVPETTEETVPDIIVEEDTEEVQDEAMMASFEGVVAAAIFFSDLHTSSSDYKQSTVNGIMTTMKNTGLPFSSVTSCGDAFSVNADNTKYTGKTSTITGYIQGILGNIPVNYVWSDHDRYAVKADGTTLLDNDSGFIYGAGADGTYGTSDDGNYYIYELSMADLSTNNRYNADFHSNTEVTATIAKFVEDATKLDQTKPLLIASHQPLLDRRNDNGHAYEWATAINTVAEDMDVFFFFGHNHYYDQAKDYYYAKGETMSVCKDSSGNAENVKLNFTHLCTGYMSPTTTANTTRQGVAMAVTIYEDAVNLTTYNASGVYTGNYALNETVTRAHATAEPDVPETSEPIEEDVEQKDEATGIVVAAPGLTGIEVTVMAEDSAAYAAVAEKLSQYTCYDIEALGYTDGDLATVIMPIPVGVTNPAVYHVSDDAQTVTRMNTTKTADGSAVTFTTNHFSYYVIGEDEVDEEPSNSVTTGGTTYEEKTVYVRVDSFENGEKYLLIGEDAPSNGNPVALVNSNGSDITAAVTVNSDSITADGVTYSKGYIELSNSNAVFEASGSSSNGYTLKNGSYYIGGTGATTLYNSSNSAVRVKYDSGDARMVTASGTTRYLYYSTYGSETWKWSTSKDSTTSSRAMYIYKEVTTQIPTSNEVTYTMQASNLDVILSESGTTTGQLSYALLGNGEAVAPSGGSYSFGVVGDTSGIISSISNKGVVTFTGKEGSCRVKIAYTWDGNTVYKYVTVTAQKPFHVLEITSKDGEIIESTQSAKGDVAGTSHYYSAKLLLNGETESDIDLTKVIWTSSDQAIATVDANGQVVFSGGEGTVQITATYEYGDAILTDTINIKVTKDVYVYPSDGTNDFPEYPNEGAIRYNKTAESVGTFSETGVAKVELSMTGVPYTTNNKLDVVLMLDRSSSMTDTRINATKAAVKVFIKNVVMNEDGTYNGNRIYVGDFLGGNPEYAGQSQHNFKITSYTNNEEDGYQIVNDTAEYNALIAKVDSTFKRQNSSYGTEYAQSLEYCYDLLNATKEDGNKQFCVFMSDGIPNVFQYAENSKYESTGDLAEMFTGTNYNTRSSKYHYEYHSTRMKANGVTVFSVGLGLENTNSAWSGVSATACLNAASLMLNDISGPAGETAPDTGTTLSKKDEYFFSVADANAAAGMENVFGTIAQKILEAATNVVVTDKVSDEYTMVFDIPQGTDEDNNKNVASALADQEFYIEFLEYALDANHERTTSTSKLKLYLGISNNTYYAATANGSTNGANKFADPVFTAKTGDTRAYWSVVDNSYAAKYGEIVIKVGSTTYKFIENGTGTHNMTSGAYAYGTIDATTKMSSDLVIVTPYFAYSAGTRMLAWTVDKLTTVEYALSYFLYLDNSATQIGTGSETREGPYPTNDHAYLTYINFNGKECRQEFPIPQLTWNGAQVSYVFYLVNKQGQPINKSGQVVDFANATFVTDIHTKHVVWNDDETTKDQEGKAYLDANYEANTLLSSDYTLYDQAASYVLLVYEDHEGSDLKNYFTIGGSEANGSVSSTTKVYNTKAGTKYSAYGTYRKENVVDGFDFAHTTVAFAVVWNPALVPDSVVVDYGLDVLIDVVRNDLLQNTVSGISKTNSSYGSIAMNTGISTTAKFGSAGLTIDGNSITIEDENRVRFHQGDMEFKTPVTFYYESPVKFYENSNEQNGYLYSSVTVIPATTIYYEDDFLTLTSFSKENGSWSETADSPTKWTTEGSKVTSTQDQDRPGESQISAALDADNNYGYDSAYESMSTHSLGSSAKITVDANTRGEATFTFWGTGFDVISTTSNDTGTITVKVTDADGNTEKSSIVDTYYGYTRNSEGNWVVTTGDNALYQVPVMKHFGMEYGQYTVKITAGYNEYLDHTGTENEDGSKDGYDLYLDAIRIYDPTGNKSDVANDAYVQDGEGWPSYFEVRDQIISKTTFDSLNDESVSGIVFIDGIGNTPNVKDYTSYGPNNETYLAKDQAIAFDLNGVYTVPDGKKLAKIQLAIKTVGGEGKVEVYGVKNGTTIACLNETISTATDMYYDITTLEGMTVVIKSLGDAIISVTNAKVTYAPVTVATASIEDETTDASMLFSVRRASVDAAIATLTMEEEVPETSEPSVPETSEPEETEPVKPSKSDLKDAVDAAKKLKEKDYTKSSFKAVKSAIKSAEKVLKNKKATDTQIEVALDALNAAVEALEAKPDSAALKKAVDAARKLKEKNYTKDSFKTFKAALKAAQKVLKDSGATQAEIDEALAELNEAMDTLVKKSSGAKPGKKR